MFALKVLWYRLVMLVIKMLSFLMPQGKPLLLSGCGSSLELARTVASPVVEDTISELLPYRVLPPRLRCRHDSAELVMS